MRTDRVTMIAIAGALFGAVAAGPASAEFGDCADPGYLARFAEDLSVGADGCVEIFSGVMNAARGVRTLRVIHTADADFSATPTFVDAARTGARGAVDALNAMGGFDAPSITVFLRDDVAADEDAPYRDFSSVVTAPPSDGECVIAAPRRSGADAVAFGLAHEIFHCVQRATAGISRVRTVTGAGAPGGDWWVDGSAEWFAAHAIPGSPEIDRRAAQFDRLSHRRAIYEMGHEAAPLFFWLAQRGGPGAIFDLMPGLPQSADATAQRAALRALMSGANWNAFAADYLDDAIEDELGLPFGFSPDDGAELHWEESAEQPIALTPFLIARGVASFACGQWSAQITPDPGLILTRRAGVRGDWRDLPGAIDAASALEAQHRFVGVATDESVREAQISATLGTPCALCGGTGQIDACVVGAWRMSGGGAAEWMRANLPPSMSMPNFEDGGEDFVLYRADGSYLTGPYSFAATILAETPEGVVRGDGGAMVMSSGRWSASDGQLYQCTDMQAVSGGAEVAYPDGGRASSTFAGFPPGETAFGYRCAGGALETRVDVPGMPPLRTEFERLDVEIAE